VVGLFGPFVFGYPGLSIEGSYISVPLLTAPVVYWFISNRDFTNIPQSTLPLRGTIALYVILWSGATLTVTLYERSFYYYGLIGMCFTLVFWQIFHYRDRRPLRVTVLLEIALSFLNVVYGVTLQYYFYVGGTDPLAHAYYIRKLLEVNQITEAFAKYESFPLHHLLVGSINLIGGSTFPTRKWNVLFVGIVGVVGLLFTYVLVERLFEDWRYAATTTVLLAINPFYIYYMMRAIPRSVMTVFTIFIFLTTLRIGRRWWVVSTITVIVLIIYHTVSIPFVVAILLLSLLTQLVFAERQYTSKTTGMLFLIGIGTIAYWTFNAEFIFLALISAIISSPVNVPASGISFGSVGVLEELWNDLQFAVVILFSILGGVWSLKRTRLTRNATAVVLVGTVLIALTFPGPLGFIERLEMLELRRWSEYTVPLVSVAAGTGLLTLYDRIEGSTARNVLLAGLLVTSGLSVSNDLTTPENPIMEVPSHSPYLERSEIEAAHFAVERTNGEVMADYVSYRYLQWSDYSNRPHIMEVSREGEIQTNPRVDTILFRAAERDRNGLWIYPVTDDGFRYKPRWRGGGILEFYPKSGVDKPMRRACVYDNGKAAIYT
jgi:hypothetical protein